jgi:hypothetical protein
MFLLPAARRTRLRQTNNPAKLFVLVSVQSAQITGGNTTHELETTSLNRSHRRWFWFCIGASL